MHTFARRLALSLSLAVSASFAQQTSATQPLAKSPTTTYTDSALHYSYTYASVLVNDPAMAKAALEEEKSKSTGVKRAATECVSSPLVAMDTNDHLHMALIVRIDFDCMGIPVPPTPEGVALSTLKESLSRFGTPTMDAAVAYKIADSPAEALSGSVVSEKYGATFYGSAACTLIGNSVVCWEFVANECSALPALQASPVTLEGKPATAVIPEKTLAACKP